MKNNNQTFLILFAVLLSHFYSLGQDENVVYENEIFNTNVFTDILSAIFTFKRLNDPV